MEGKNQENLSINTYLIYCLVFSINQTQGQRCLMIFIKKIKRSTKQYLIVAFICITVIGSAGIFTSIIIANQIKDEYEAKLKLAYDEMEINQRNIFVATVDIIAGDKITSDNIVEKRVYASQPTETYYMLEEEEGNLALVDIPKDTQITKTMTTKNQVSSEIREVQYDVINLSNNVYNNDTIDVRLSYPNGESYVVLSKKDIKGIVAEVPTCFFWLNEEEIHRMSAAIVDAGLYPGSKLTTTKYIEANIQDESVVTYTPSIAILTLLESDPNILERCSQELNKEVRKALENRLASSMEIEVSEISWDVNPNIMAAKTDYTKKDEPNTTDTINDTETVNSHEDSEKDIDLGTHNDDGYMFFSEEEKAIEGEVELGE